MAKILFIVAQKGFQDYEFFVPNEIFINNNCEVVVASIKKGKATGSIGGTVDADISVKDAKINDYDILAIAGGPGAQDLVNYPEMIRIVKDAVNADKLVCAICIAPTILAEAGVLKGKRATVWNGNGKPGKFIESKGATFTGKAVEIDGKIITANGPSAAKEFADKILDMVSP